MINRAAKTAIGFLFLICPVCALNSEDEFTIQPSLDIVIGGDHDYYPFTYLDSKNRPAGFDVEIIKAVGKEMGFNVNVVLGTWKDILKKLDNGEIDVVPMFVSDARKDRYEFSYSNANREYVLFGLNDASFIDSIQELAGDKLLVQKDTIAHEFSRESGVNLQVITFDEFSDLLKQLKAGDAKYLLAPRVQTQHTIKKLNIKGVGVKSSPIFSNDYTFAVKKGNEELLTLLNKGIALIHENGEYDRIFNKFEDDIYPISLTTKLVIGVFVTILLSVIVFLAYKYRQHLKLSAERLSSELKLKLEAERKAIYLINHHYLTGLPNRRNLLIFLKKRIEEANKLNKKTGCLYISIENMSQIYRSAGYEIGDELLRCISNGFNNTPEIFAGCPSSNCFAIILPLFNTYEEAVNFTNDLINRIQTRHLINNIHIEYLFCSGLAIYPNDGELPELLLRNSELSHEIAKETESDLIIYSKHFEPDSRTLKLLADFKEALLDDQFLLYFQPKHSLNVDALCGAETLVRWLHPELGLIPPGVFIPLFETTGLLKELTSHMVMNAMERAHKWNNGHCKLSVNVSAKDIISDEFIDMTINLTDMFGRNIILEITETALARKPDDFVRNVSRLNDSGINVSIDDYGTGYSSLKYLRDLAPVELKIDQAFIKNIINSYNDEILVRSTINMAHELNIYVVAEGTEDMETIIKLKELGCDVAQGFGISRPMPETEFIQWINAPNFSLKSAA